MTKLERMQFTTIIAGLIGFGYLFGVLALPFDGGAKYVSLIVFVLLAVADITQLVMYNIALREERYIKLSHEQGWRFCMVVYMATMTAAIIVPFAKLSAKAGGLFLAVGFASALLLFVIMDLISDISAGKAA